MFRFLTLLAGLGLLVGCQEMDLIMPSMNKLTFQTDKAKVKFGDDFDLDAPEEFNPPFIGEHVGVSGLNLVVLEGVGLVTSLDGTGGDPPPSQFRTQLLEDMRRRDIPDPNKIISSPSTALVIVRAYLPPLVQPGDRFDVEIRVPDGSTTTSLNGGWLLPCRLTERAIVPGTGIIEGKERARAEGPILVSIDNGENNGLLKRGVIVGGGVGLESRDMQLLLKNDMRSVRNSTRIAQRIGTRFFSYDRYGHREPLATAKTDQKIILKIHPNYKENFPRYVQVIENIAFRETEVERQIRMERLQKELMIPEKAERAALQLEAIGPDAIPMLQAGLTAPTLECRFYAAVALAYLGEGDGLEVLFEAARDEPAFRVFALAAMSCIEEGETHLYLRQLMDNSMLETRYGAFRCMTTIDDNDPFVKGQTLNKQCKLHVLDVVGDPMIHLTHSQKAEIVLFGADQRFRTPLALTAGPHIMVNSAPGSNEVVVSRYRIGEPDQRKVVSTRISEVIRTVAELGASYPDLAQMLVQAERQQNLPGIIGIDMLPEAGRYYMRPVEGNESGAKTKTAKKRMGRENMAPNSYRKGVESEDAATKPLLTPATTESEPVEDEEEGEKADLPASPTSQGAEAQAATKAASRPSAQADKNDNSEKKDKLSFNPLRDLKKTLTFPQQGELVYPEVQEE